MQSTKITNSGSAPIYIAFGSVEVAYPPPPPSQPLSPGKTAAFATQGGTMNMFVWAGENLQSGSNQGECVWKGIVPVKIEKPLIVNPNEKKVYFEGTELPEGFKPTTGEDSAKYLGNSPESKESSSSPSSSARWWRYFALGAILTIILFFVLWYMNFLPF